MSAPTPAMPADDFDAAAAEPVPLAPALPTPRQRLAQGKARRSKTSRAAHAAWQPPADRPDPIALLEESSRPRLQALVPIRYGRMLASPFTFLRGSPIVMAHDLATTPVSGIRTQICGDAHLMNFGVYASPERTLLFDVNDFDETLPGPWEWDVKRLAASCVVAGRSHGLRSQDCEEAARVCARSYRERMREYSGMRLLDIWYSRVDAQAALQVFHASDRKGISRAFDRGPPTQQLAGGLARPAGCRERRSRLRIVDDPPLVRHVNDDEMRPIAAAFLPRLLYLAPGRSPRTDRALSARRFRAQSRRRRQRRHALSHRAVRRQSQRGSAVLAGQGGAGVGLGGSPGPQP